MYSTLKIYLSTILVFPLSTILLRSITFVSVRFSGPPTKYRHKVFSEVTNKPVDWEVERGVDDL